ncbi:MAG TPA: hypothetical protein VEB40_09150 [Flavipsychrobacter sp.]|nr:hypothetical protein [Flavipsychrobacter sp.]
MTRYKLLIAVLLAWATLSSCQKKYTCKCTNGSTYQVKGKKKSVAIAACNQYSDKGPYGQWVCYLE